MLFFFVVLILFASVLAADPVPSFPLQFSAKITITAHLIAADSEYPPRKRTIKVFYDYLNKQARADIEEGYEAAKFYIRRYDTNNEYMIRLPPINDCKRSYLGELMPFPDIPNTIYVKQELINGAKCNYFLYEEFETRVHIYLTEEGSPVRLIQESTANDESTPLLTYDYFDVIVGPPSESMFELPQPFDHISCVRHVGGFPYLHIFHHFVKF